MGSILFGLVAGAGLTWAFMRRRGSKIRRSEPDLPEQFIRMDEGLIQRGNGHGGPSTPKPPIKVQPSGGRMIREGFGFCPPEAP